MAKEIAEEYTSSLADLTLNSKPLINMLTMLADDNIEHAEAIVEAVEKHLEKVRSEYKLPVLYLIDSIVKNVGRTYTTLFTQNIVHTFCSVFEKVDEKVRAQMFKLRQTWNDVFAGKKLYTLDIRVQCIDPAWPITAPAPTPSIHVNPKFFSKPAIPVPAPATIVPKNKLAPPVVIDAQTLDMQTQLINKQKELLELKQKKLELELLQAKAKLEEQQKQLERQTIQIKTPPQMPVKSEIKPYVPSVPVKLENDIKPQNTTIRGGMPPPLTAGGPRIAPVNSALLNSVRPMVRDPRLLRQQPPPSATSGIAATTTATTTQIQQITSNNFENVNIDEKHKVKSKSHNTISLDCANNDKASVNKAGAQSNTLTRKDPRLLSNKVQGSSSAANKSKSNNGRPVTNERSPNKAKLTTSSSSRKSSSKSSNSSSSRSFKNSGPQTIAAAAAKVLDGSNLSSTAASAATDGHSKSINNKDNSSSTSKGNSDMANKVSPLSSPAKYKKKTIGGGEHSSPQQQPHPKRNKNSFAGSKGRSRDRLPTSAAVGVSSIVSAAAGANDKYDDDSLRTASPLPVAVTLSNAAGVSVQDQRTFKGLKVSTKNRNYMRRNRTVSVSPEPTTQDVDLRVGGPPEKQARLQPPQLIDTTDEAGKSTTIDDSPANKDVDLRTLVVPAAVNKKRSSTEKLEASVAKKSKSQMFDVLFGNEDVDLRQLPPPVLQASATTPTTTTSAVPTTNQNVLRPPTPPPPIISTPPSSKNEAKETNTWPRTKENKTSFQAIRAKLANATKISTFSEDGRKNASEDTDMRLKSAVLSSESAEDVLQKIIISQADEQLIKNGNLSQALVERVLTLFETQKLKEAQRRESEEVKSTEFGNINLTPISDDELSAEFSHSDSDDDTKTTRKTDLPSFGDTDERIPPPAPVISQSSTTATAVNSISEHQKAETGHVNVDPRLQSASRVSQQNMDHGTSSWHGHHRRRRPKTHWDSPPPPHAGTDQWLRPPPAAVLNQQQQMYGMRRQFPPFVRPPADNFGPRMDMLPSMVPAHVLDNTRTSSPPTIGSQNTKELPLADPLVLEYIDQDTMRTINIDGRPREIRYYEETAIVILNWDDPREISFQNGSRVITFDDKETFTLSFNDAYRDVTIGGNAHRIRLGAPTRELYIDGKWYECFFGGPGIGIEVDGKMRVVKMDGPPPHVKIGTVKRTDLVAGKINLIINARTMVPVFLDAKPQKFDIEGKIHTLRFVDALKTVLINEVPFKVEFGGLPKPITVHDKKHFIRFSVLPRGIKPGYIKIANMEGQRYPSPPPRADKETSNDATPIESINVATNEPALPMLGKRRARPTDRDSPDSSRNSPTMQNASSLDVLSSIITSPMANSNNVSGYQLETRDPSAQDSQDGFPIINPTEIPGLFVGSETTQTPSAPQFLPPNLNINDLFQKLVASGIVTSAKEKTPPPPAQKPEEPEPVIRPVLFTQTETLKTRQQPLIAALYCGMQCSSCGVRFPPEHSMQYSQHLDWHFRQNRRGRNSARKALCRKWYYEVSDWKNFEEIEDIEEREKNWFESQQQQQQAEGVGEDGDEEIEIPSVPADSNTQDTCCDVCHDKFEQFYNEEKEEWHLRMAIRVDDKTYHPLCYDDYKASLMNATLEETFHNNTVSESIEDAKENIELKNEEPEIKEDEPTNTEDKLKEEEKMEVEETAEEEEEDDDVVIEEPNIEQIEIDDKLEHDDDDEDESIKIDNMLLPGGIKIKQEPMDDDGPDGEMCLSNIKTEPVDPELEDHHVVNTVMAADTTHAEVVSSIDGNVQLSSGPSAVGIAGKIKINITKPLLAAKEQTSTTDAADMTGDSSAENAEPLPPGEEPVQLQLKPALQGLTLVKQPTVSKGTELTGLCSIM